VNREQGVAAALPRERARLGALGRAGANKAFLNILESLSLAFAVSAVPHTSLEDSPGINFEPTKEPHIFNVLQVSEAPNISLTRFEGFSTIAPCLGLLMRL
jgi:hypothetical protein